MLVEFQNTRGLLSSKGSNGREYKIVVLGSRKVGKSALVVRFLTKRFISEYLENADMLCKRVTDVDGEPLKVHIQDTSDKALRSNIMEQQVRWADAIILVYSTTDSDSFEQLKNAASKMAEKVFDVEEKDQNRVPHMVLVGNKGDLDYVRQVTRKDGFELAEKLRCDFFEASAREGWSKLITKQESPSCSPSNDVDLISLFAGAIGTVGMVGVPHKEVSRGMTRCLTPTLGRKISPVFQRRYNQETNKSGFKRWGSFNGLNRLTISAPNGCLGVHSSSNSPSVSEDECDNNKFSAAPLKSTRSPHSTFIGKLSPRLSRKTPRSTRNDLKEKKMIAKDDNNNNNKNGFKSTLAPNSIASGLSSSLFASAKLGETLCGVPARHRLSSGSTISDPNSLNTSTSGSTESLSRREFCSSPNFNSLTPEQRRTPVNMSSRSTPVLKEPIAELKLQAQDFSSSEPFLILCRARIAHLRSHSRYSANKILNSFKKIKSLAVEHGANSQNLSKQATMHANGTQNLLSVPIVKF